MAAEPWPTAALAAPGYTAAINTPTAQVLPWGGATLALGNSNPERARRLSSGSFGSLNAGFGLLPGLELVGRLAFEGDLQCNLYDPACGGGQRDLSLSGKYQLPVELPLDTRLAVGFTDYGGAATNYRQVYGVATSTWGPLDLSLGYGKPRSASALLDGPFAAVALRIDERWSAALEHDSRAARLGLQWRQPLTRDLALQLGASRSLNEVARQQPWQMNAQLNWMLGQPAGSPLALAPRIEPAPDLAVVRPPSTPVLQPLPGPDAETLAQLLSQAGFARVGVRVLPASEGRPALWRVQAESLRWRQSHLDALGAALQAWRQLLGDRPDELALTLTYQGQPVLGAHTSGACLQAWLAGDGAVCALPDAAEPLSLYRLADWPESLRERMVDSDGLAEARAGLPAWLPQWEIGPGLRTTVGTEYGLWDYSLALELGFEAGLAPGLSLQGVASTPVSHSDDFEPRKVFAAQRHPEAGLDSLFLSYWRPLPYGLALQGALGQLNRHEDGGQLDASWMSADGRWRLAGLGGRYTSDLDQRLREPRLASLRYSVAPGAWHLDATAGRFMNGDEGYRLTSSHWMGDVRFSVYYRNSQTPQAELMPARSFMGFEFSLPLGPRESGQFGPVAIRGRDRWGWGLESKVGEKDNYLTPGYGLIPRLRHGLTSDVTDHDRSGAADLQAQLPRLRAMLSRP